MLFDTIHILYLILRLVDFSSSLPYDNLNRTNIYGNDYGSKWIYFPDGDGVPRYVNLRTSSNGSGIDMRESYVNGIEFRLYIGNDSNSYIELNESGHALKAIHQDDTQKIMSSDQPIKIITHGWKSSADKDGVADLKSAYLDIKNVTVITVDWSVIAESIFYPWVAYEASAVGTKVATLINALQSRYNITSKNFHLIGHSLGAHIMGIAASEAKFTVDRITGLDPARPLFEYPVLEHLKRLDASDANFVDIIHTCRGVLGYEAPIGTVDFYPNSGFPPQPGCGSVQKIFEACSHGRSYVYFAESIKYPSAFPAHQCQNWFEHISNMCSKISYMGDNVDRNSRGSLLPKDKFIPSFWYSFIDKLPRLSMDVIIYCLKIIQGVISK